MANTVPQTALPQTGANDSIATILYTIEGIINQALAHHISHISAYCILEPKDHGANQHKYELKAKIPSKLEAILERRISGEEWLAVQRLRSFMNYATSSDFDWEKYEMFEMMSDHFSRVYDYVLGVANLARVATQSLIYYRPKSQRGGEGFETSKA